MDFYEYLEALKEPGSELKVSELRRLSGLSTEHAEAFAQAWSAIGLERRRRIVRELIDLEDDNVDLNFDAVFLRGFEDDDAEIRRESVKGLWERERPDVIKPLIQLLRDDDDAAVRAEAALALGRFVLLSEEGRLRERHFREVETGLRAVVDEESEVAEVRARALEAIGPHDAAWVREAIRNAYESGVRRLKVAAVHAMGRSCESRWLPLLIRELSNDEPEIRYEAASALGFVGDEQAVPHLLRSLSDPDQEVRDASITALGEIGGKEAREALLNLSRDDSEAVREAAREALAEIDFEEDPLSFRYRL